MPDLGMGRVNDDVLVDATGDPLALTPAVRDVVRAIDVNLPIYDVKTVRQRIDDGRWPFRVFGSLFSTFGFASLFLATVGLYAVMAFSVSRRTQEIGVRMAVGASGGDVLRLVMRQGLVQIASGIVLGLGLGALLGTGLKVLLFDVNPYDPGTFLMIVAVLAFTGLGACFIPARRAAAVDPMVALRCQ